VFAAILNRQIARPLAELSRATARMSDGDISARAAVPARDELGALAHSFNEMAERISNRDTALRAEKFTLSQHVAERTAELRDANRELREEIERRTQVQAALSESETLTRLVVDTALDAVISMDATGIIRAWNAQAARIFGWTAEEAVGRPLAETIVPPTHREAHRRGLKHFLATGEGPVLNTRVEINALHRDGREFPIELSIAPMKVSSGWIFSAFARDITERKRAESRLRESEERFSKTFQTSPAFIALIRLEDGIFVNVNEAFLKASGYTEAEVLGRTSVSLNLYALPEQRDEYLRQIREHRSVRDREHLVRTKGGALRTMLVSGELLELDGHAYVLTVGLDITARKQAEAELVKSLERERELGELKTSFVSMVSHEFRTPLEVITTSADILERYLDRLAAPERTEHLAAIQHSVKRMAGMMENVLLLGRFESERQQFRPDDLHLPVWCHRFVDEMRSATGGKCPIELELPEDLPLASADENLLRHILTNLLTNAVKYSPPGSPVRIAVTQEGDEAVLRVVDSGIGILPTDRAHLFEAFHRGGNTGQIPGTGLGLVIVKRSVELHGGSISCTSSEGRGTTFTIRLPVFNRGTA